MEITRNREGAWVIYDTVNGYLETRQYHFYTKKEAISLFKQEMRGMK